MPAAKIAVVGDVNGQFGPVFQKLNALHAKNAFSLAIIAGNLFADPQTAAPEDDQNVEELIKGSLEISLPIYFALGSYAMPRAVIDQLAASEESIVCPNLYYLGKRTTTTTSDGVRIVALGGRLDSEIGGNSKDKFLPSYSEADAKTLKGATQCDVLITSEWPSAIRKGSKIKFGENKEPTSHACISELCSTLRPRYHFSVSQTVFFEREPFFHPPRDDAPDQFHITRFLSLAAYNNPAKAKWIYAFSVDPKSAPAIAIPVGTTASPLSFASNKRVALPDQDTYRFSELGHDTYERPFKRKKHREKGPPPTQNECYFCLSNPSLPTHLVTSIGTEAYVTTAKGPLPTSKTFKSLGLPCHLLIIPMSHSPTISLIQDPESRDNTRKEMARYREAIQKMIAKKSSGELGAVTWEISRASGFHTHWQILPISSDLVSRGLVEAAFKVEAENKSHPHIEKGDPDESVDFYRIWIFDAKAQEEKSLYMPLDAGFRDLQYARRVLAKLLRLEGRTMWQDCGQTAADEEADAEAFKKAFEGFDPAEE